MIVSIYKDVKKEERVALICVYFLIKKIRQN